MGKGVGRMGKKIGKGVKKAVTRRAIEGPGREATRVENERGAVIHQQR